MLGLLLARVREDRLLRWTAYATVPAIWFAIGLANPFVLLIPPMVTLALWTAMRYDIVAREDPVEDNDPDFDFD